VLKKRLWESRSTPTLVHNCGECRIANNDTTTNHQHLLVELFGPGHFVGLGLRLKSEIWTRTRTFEIVTFLHLDPKLSVSESFIFGENIVIHLVRF
jgi:hypothetical protein